MNPITPLFAETNWVPGSTDTQTINVENTSAVDVNYLKVTCHECNTEFAVYIMSRSIPVRTEIVCPKCGTRESVPQLGEKVRLTCDFCGHSFVQGL